MAIRNSRDEREGTGKLYYSISEVAELVDVKAHVLRYWETQFKMLHPRKNRAGNRSYRIRDVKMALRIKKLLYDEGFTIAGARRKLLDERKSRKAQTELDFVGISHDDFLKMLRRDLTELLQVVQGERRFEALIRKDEEEEEERRDEEARRKAEPQRAGIFGDLDLSASGEAEGEDETRGTEAPARRSEAGRDRMVERERGVRRGVTPRGSD